MPDPGTSPNHWPSRRAAAAFLAAGSLFRAVAGEPPPLRLGLSESLARDVNLADARAAMQFWIRKIAEEMNIHADCAPGLFESIGRIEEHLRAARLDAVGINILEYRRIAPLLDKTDVVVPVMRTQLEYVLLVRADATLRSVSGLRGGRLTVLDSSAACLAPAWLSNLLAPVAPHGPERFFSAIARKAKPSQAILPVFFGQAEACLTTNPSFVTMSELNPQVAARLRVLAVSPEIVHNLYAFRRNWNNDTRHRLVKAFPEMSRTPVGRQVMTMFQCDGLAVKDASCLDSSLTILEQAERAGWKEGSGP